MAGISSAAGKAGVAGVAGKLSSFPERGVLKDERGRGPKIDFGSGGRVSFVHFVRPPHVCRATTDMGCERPQGDRKRFRGGVGAL